MRTNFYNSIRQSNPYHINLFSTNNFTTVNKFILTFVITNYWVYCEQYLFFSTLFIVVYPIVSFYLDRLSTIPGRFLTKRSESYLDILRYLNNLRFSQLWFFTGILLLVHQLFILDYLISLKYTDIGFFVTLWGIAFLITQLRWLLVVYHVYSLRESCFLKKIFNAIIWAIGTGMFFCLITLLKLPLHFINAIFISSINVI